MHPAALPPDALLADVQEMHTRRSGPGGQHRNKVQTAVVLVHRPTGIAAEAGERRSQAENRRVALGRLRLKLALEHRTPASTTPSARWQDRVRGRQLAVAVDHPDYPALVAEALDRLQAHALDMPATAAALGVTTTQLLKLFKKTPVAWTTLNRLRIGVGLPVLK
jgi:protein subunit release factor B